MTREMEERIVAMYFDNKDFEKNAKTTIDTLGQLKKSLKLDDDGKSFDVFEKIGKTLNFENAGKALNKMKNTLSGMGSVFKKVFSIGPIDDAFRAVDNFKNNYLDKIIGFDVADKLVNAVEKTFRELTIEPISAGWNQYESKMDSVKTIMSSTGESIDVVNKKLDEMTDYANKTIYSLTDMTSNLGKFTNNGVKLDDAIAAMEGIANAAADAGQGSQQASMAMYNISQAMGVGKMTTIDWKSLENANIATTRLKETFLEMAAIHGKLEKKTSKTGSITYMLTKDENGKKLKNSIELTAANFREYLSKGWLDKQSMLDALKVYSGTITENELERMGVHDKETKKHFMEIGKNALEAATQVRTFTKMMDALKESVQSGWAQSFELIFGNMEEGTTLWTGLNERLDSILSEATKKRNKILEIWRTTDENGNKIKKDKQGNTDKSVQTGRDIMIESLYKAMDLAKELSTLIFDPFEKVFGKFSAKTLTNITVGFRNFVDQFKKWLGSTEKGNSRFFKLKKIMMGVFSVIKAGITIIKAIANLIKKIAGPVIDFLIDKFSVLSEFFMGLKDLNAGQIIEKLGEGIKTAWDRVKKFFSPTQMKDANGKPTGDFEIPAIVWLRELWSKLTEIVKEWAYDNGLGGIWESITGWWENLKSAFNEGWQKVVDVWTTIKSWFTTSGLAGFFGNAWNFIKSLFSGKRVFFSTEWYEGKTQEQIEAATLEALAVDTNDSPDEEDNGPLEAAEKIKQWLTDAKETIEKFWNETVLVTFKPLWDDVGTFITNLAGWIVSIFTPTVNEETGEKGEAPIISWIKGTYESISGFWNNTLMPTLMPIGRSISNFIRSVAGWFIYQFTPTVNEETGEKGEAPIISWIKGTYESISGFWNNTLMPTLMPIGRSISNFIRSVAGWFIYQFTPTVDEETGEKGDSPIVAWIKKTCGVITTFWNDTFLPAIEPIGLGISNFITNVWAWITDKFTPTVDAETGEKGDSPIVAWIKQTGEAITTFWNDTFLPAIEPIGLGISNFITNVGAWITDKFSPTVNEETGEKEDAPIVKWLNQTLSDIQGIWERITGLGIWKEIGKFLTDTFNWIMEVTGLGELTSTPDTGTNNLKNSGKSLGRQLAFANQLSGVVTDAGTSFFGGGGNTSEIDPNKAEERVNLFQKIIDALSGFFTSIKEAASEIVRSDEMRRFIDSLGTFFSGLGSLLTTILDFLGRAMKGELTTGEYIGAAVGGILTVIVDIFRYKNNANLAKISSDSQSIGLQFLEIAGGLLLIATAVSILTAIDQNKMYDAAKVIGALGLVVGVVLAAITALNNSISANRTTGVERFFTNLINKAFTAGTLYIIISAIPPIIKAIQDAKSSGVENIGEDILKICEGIALLFSSVSLTLGALNYIAPSGISPAAATKTALAVSAVAALMVGVFEVIGGIPSLLGQWVEGDQEKGVNAAAALIERGGLIMSKLGIAIGSFFGGLIGSFSGGAQAGEIVAYTNGLSDAANIMSTISPEALSSLSTMLGFALEIYKAFGDASVLDILDRVTGGGKLKTFGEQLPSIGEGLAGLVQYTRGFTNEDMDRLRDSMRIVGYFANAISLIYSVVNGRNGSSVLESSLASKAVFQQYAEAAELLSDAVKKALRNEDGSMTGLEFNAMPIVEAICNSLEGGSYAISAAVRKLVNAGLEEAGKKNPEVSNSQKYKTPEGLVTFYQELQGIYKDSNGDTINLNDIVTNLIGDESTFDTLMGQMDKKTSVLDEKWTNLTSVFGNFDITKVKTVDPNTGAETETSLLEYFQSQLTDLSETLNNMDPLKVTVTPVFDLSNLTPASLQEQLNNSPVPFSLSGANASFDTYNLGELNSALGMSEIKAILSDMNNAINNWGSQNVSITGSLASHMDGISAEIARMKLYLDTGLLVGAITPLIDSELMRNYLVQGRQ